MSFWFMFYSNTKEFECDEMTRGVKIELIYLSERQTNIRFCLSIFIRYCFFNRPNKYLPSKKSGTANTSTSRFLITGCSINIKLGVELSN